MSKLSGLRQVQIGKLALKFIFAVVPHDAGLDMLERSTQLFKSEIISLA